MREWFTKLAAVNRNNEAIAKKIQADWLTYMELLVSRETNRFLGLETDDEGKREEYLRGAYEEAVQIASIESGFAEAISPQAVETLRQIRARPSDDFSYSGELAPEGYR
jgi:hypothetical protein